MPYNIFYIVWLVAFIWSVYDIWTGRKETNMKIVWTIVCLVFPVLGVLIYLLAGRK